MKIQLVSSHEYLQEGVSKMYCYSEIFSPHIIFTEKEKSHIPFNKVYDLFTFSSLIKH